jgi:cytochrome c oxidase subunit II
VRKRPLLQMLVMGAIGLAILIPIALLIPWFPTIASKQASHAKTLYDVLLVLTIPIFVGVETVVLFSVWKFRMRPGEEEKDGPPIHGNTRLEVVWTAAPAVLILSLCIYAYTVLRSNEDSAKGETTINVTERQFAFEFSYPQANGQQVVSPELYLADNHPYLFHIRSLDVIHSFFVPDFSEKIDAVPGITTDLRVTPTRVGSYPAECTELCGAGHSLMRTFVRVLTPAAFQSWLSSQKPNGPPPIGTPPPLAAQPGVPGGPSGAPAPAAPGGAPSTTTTTTPSTSSAPATAAGKAVFTGSAGCSSCHTLAAAGASGTVGPNLDVRLRTDCASAASTKIRGATLAQCINTAITKPYAFLPPGYAAGVMPATFAQTLTPTQIQSLVTFLSSVAK